MNIKHEFNRIGHLLHNGVDKTHDLAAEGVSQAAGVSRRLRREVESSSGPLVSAEEALVRHVRQNPALYLVTAALVIGALIAKVIIESSRDRKLPG